MVEHREGDTMAELDVDDTVEFEFVSNVKVGAVSLDCCGLRCSGCGHVQIDLTPPKRCPECGRLVKCPQ